MFDGCANLTTAPELPATTLADSCYAGMFYGCTSLTTAPELPATILTSWCYKGMFYGCTRLTTVPTTLPATTLKDYCYSDMFYDCTRLTTAPELPATTLASNCCDSMFQGCTSLTTAPELPATTLAIDCYLEMFYGCTSLTTAPDLPATTLVDRCYRRMFDGCTKLNYIKMLATNISASSCLYMWVNDVASSGTFVKNKNATWNVTGVHGIPSGWTVVNDTDNYLTIEALEDGLVASLSTNACEYCIDGDGNWKSLAAGTPTEAINNGHTLLFRGNLTPSQWNGVGTFTISKKCNLKGNCMSMLFGDNAADNYSLNGKGNAFRNLFENCTNIVNVSKNFLPATTLAYSCYYYMFYGCTSLTTAPELPATTLASGCYEYMFYGCTNLTTAPELPATTLAGGCYHYMFYGCTSLTTAPELSATTVAESCYYNMFSGCTNLTTAPTILPATTLANSCYAYMFRDCTSLVNAPELPATTLADYCCDSMFYGCSSLTIAPSILPATTLAACCYYEMFRDCTNLTTAPELPATILEDYCYHRMFYNCTKLNYIKALFTTTPSADYTSNWVYGVASAGTFVKNKNATWNITGASGVPSGWTVVDNEEESDNGEESGGNNEITFYINGQGSITPVKALSGMTWGEFVNSEYANRNSVYTNFRLLNMGSYNGIMFYHKDAMYDMILCNDSSHVSIVGDNDIIEDGKTYYAY